MDVLDACVVIFTLLCDMLFTDGITFTPGWKTSAHECECKRDEGERKWRTLAAERIEGMVCTEDRKGV